MRLILIVAGLVAVAVVPAAAQMGNPAGRTPGTPQSEPGQPAPHHPNAQDRLFVYLAHTGGLAEVAAGRSAEKRASSAAVRDFARRMVQDHSKANEQLVPLAKAANIPLPETPDPDHRAQQSELDKLSGAAFDRAYMQQQLVGHQKMTTILQWQIGSGQDPALQRHATQNLPIVLEHLRMAQVIIAELTKAAPQGLAASSASQPVSGAQAERVRYRPAR
jgi:putative membrane protein